MGTKEGYGEIIDGFGYDYYGFSCFTDHSCSRIVADYLRYQ